MFYKVDSNPDNNLEFDELKDFIEGNEIASRLFVRFEPIEVLKESLKLFEKFPKISPKYFEKFYQEAMKVIPFNHNMIDSPESIFGHMLQISDKRVPLPPVSIRPKQLSKEMEKSIKEHSMPKVGGADKRKGENLITDNSEVRNESILQSRPQ
jgi:hypothetical protein